MSIVTVDANPQHWLRHQTNRKYCSWIGFVDVGGSPSVLLCVDDQETVLEIRKRLLEAEGYRVLTATAAHESTTRTRLLPRATQPRPRMRNGWTPRDSERGSSICCVGNIMAGECTGQCPSVVHMGVGASPSLTSNPPSAPKFPQYCGKTSGKTDSPQRTPNSRAHLSGLHSVSDKLRKFN
jgi:hypothetical protein